MDPRLIRKRTSDRMKYWRDERCKIPGTWLPNLPAGEAGVRDNSGPENLHDVCRRSHRAPTGGEFGGYRGTPLFGTSESPLRLVVSIAKALQPWPTFADLFLRPGESVVHPLWLQVLPAPLVAGGPYGAITRISTSWSGAHHQNIQARPRQTQHARSQGIRPCIAMY